MTKKDILELKRRMKKEACTFTKLCGCYVDGNKNIILKINETFLNLKDVLSRNLIILFLQSIRLFSQKAKIHVAYIL